MINADWGYEAPTEASLLAEFAKSMGAEAADKIWTVVCHKLSLPRPVTALPDLVRAADAMIELGDLTRVAGRGARIRIATYRALSARV